MYFANEQHKANYDFLMNLYRLEHNKRVDYEASIYIASYPQIFKCYNKSKIGTEYGPLVYLLKEEERKHHNPAALTGSTRCLLEAGFSMYNGKGVDLASLLNHVNEQMFEVFMQACRIRAQLHLKINS